MAISITPMSVLSPLGTKSRLIKSNNSMSCPNLHARYTWRHKFVNSKPQKYKSHTGARNYGANPMETPFPNWIKHRLPIPAFVISICSPVLS